MSEEPRNSRSADASTGNSPLEGEFREIVLPATSSLFSAVPPLKNADNNSLRVTAHSDASDKSVSIIRADLRHRDGRTEDVDLLFMPPEPLSAGATAPSPRTAETLQRTIGLVRSGRPGAAADQLVSDWLSVLDDAVSERQATSGTLTESQRTWLVESGAMTEDQISAAQARVKSGSLERAITSTKAKSVVDSLSPQEVSKLLGISTSTVSHRRADGSLYGVAVGRNRRYPTWQFVGNRPLPHLARLLAAISPQVHPATINGLMRNPQPELSIDGQPTEPWAWLSNGGSIEPVLQLLDRNNRE